MEGRGGHSGCHEDLQAAEGRTVVSLPSGKGAGVAMFSARFDGGPMERKFRAVHKILVDNKYDVMMVAADAGENFGDKTTEYLGRLQREKGKMLAVCTKNYGEKTASAYSSFKELKFALDYEDDIQVVPLKVEETYPPEPPGGPNHKYDKTLRFAMICFDVFWAFPNLDIIGARIGSSFVPKHLHWKEKSCRQLRAFSLQTQCGLPQLRWQVCCGDCHPHCWKASQTWSSTPPTRSNRLIWAVMSSHLACAESTVTWLSTWSNPSEADPWREAFVSQSIS